MSPYRKLQDHAARLIHVERQVGEITDRLAQLAANVDQLRRLTERGAANAALAARRTHPVAPYRVLFLVHHPEAWYSLADVYAGMASAPDFDTLVASIPRWFPGASGHQDEGRAHDALTGWGVPHVRFNHEDSFADLTVARAFAPDVIFRQSQWDPDVPAAFATAELTFARLCLVPYETMSLIETPVDDGELNPSYDCPYYRSAWRVFHANPMIRSVALRHAVSANPGHHVVTGHPKADVITRALASAEPEPQRPFTVLWSPHHSITDEWNRFGTFHQTAFEMVNLAKLHPDWHFVLSMHPALVTRIDNPAPPLTHDFVERFRTQWSQLPNTEFFPGGDYAPLFAHSDALVSDGLSWLLEYQFAKKPVIFLERPDHRRFNDVGERALSGVTRVRSVDEAADLLEGLAAGRTHDLRSEQDQIVEQLFGAPGAADRIIAAIRDGLTAESAAAVTSDLHQ